MIKVSINNDNSLHLVLNYNKNNKESEYKTNYNVAEWQKDNLIGATEDIIPFETPAAAAAPAEGGGRLRRKRSKRNSRKKTRSKRNSRRRTKRKI